ncbi:MAG: hypothetical protein AAF741_03605 [Bacteroidota bacterium]
MQEEANKEIQPGVSTPVEGIGLQVLGQLKDWSLIFGVVGLIYMGCLIGGGVVSLIGIPSMLWHLMYMTLGFHLNVIVVLCAIIIGLSSFTFTRAAVFSKEIDTELSLAKRPSIQSLRHLRAGFMGLCLLIVTIAFSLLYLVFAMYMATALPE